jgi:hypothetical protein
MLLGLVAVIGCGRSHPATASQIGSWLKATHGVLLSWHAGSISDEAAQSHLQATLEMLNGEQDRRGDEELANRIQFAIVFLKSAQRSVAKGDKPEVLTAANLLDGVARKLSEP